jgi:hypothetical protein
MTQANWPMPEGQPAPAPSTYVPPQQVHAPPPPRGWYPDPRVQGQERWWSGFDWTEATHAASFSHPASSLGAYTRSRWAGLNRAAKYAEYSAGAGVAVFFVWFVIVTLNATGFEDVASLRVAFTVFVLALIVATITLGGLGLARSTLFGGAALAGWSLTIGILLAFAFAVSALAFGQL